MSHFKRSQLKLGRGGPRATMTATDTTGTPGLLDLPRDVLAHVVQSLGTRSQLMAACACTDLRDVVASLPLRPCVTARNVHGLMRWMALPRVAARVQALTARRCLWGRHAFLRGLPALRSLTVAFDSVDPSAIKALPDTLEHLRLHRLDGAPDAVFSTTRLRRLTRLRTLELTFMPTWDMVFLDGLQALPLDRLVIRHADTLVVRCPLAVPHVRLQAVSSLVLLRPLECLDLHLECRRSAVMYEQAVAPTLRSFSLSCPRRSTLMGLDSWARLETLHARLDSVLVPLSHLARLPRLREVTLEARYGITALVGRFATKALPPAVRVRALVGGVPLPEPETRAMFHGVTP